VWLKHKILLLARTHTHTHRESPRQCMYVHNHIRENHSHTHSRRETKGRVVGNEMEKESERKPKSEAPRTGILIRIKG